MKMGSPPGTSANNGSDTAVNESTGAAKMQHLDSSFDGPSASNNAAAAADNVSTRMIFRIAHDDVGGARAGFRVIA